MIKNGPLSDTRCRSGHKFVCSTAAEATGKKNKPAFAFVYGFIGHFASQVYVNLKII
jgi:hypothetical protein